MATVYVPLSVGAAVPFSTTFPEVAKVDGSATPVFSLKFDAALDEAAYWQLPIFNLGSGGTAVIRWYADSASSGDVVWEVTLAAITPDTDSQDVETKALASINKATDSHLGTTGQRVHTLSVTLTNNDSWASLDQLWVRIRRLGSSDAADTMAGDAQLLDSYISYSDT